MRASVGRDHARSTQHLDLNSDVSRTLGDPVVVVVGRGAHRAGHTASDAALEGTAIEPGVSAASVGAGTSKRRPLALIGRALLCLFGQLRHRPSGGSITSEVRGVVTLVPRSHQKSL